MSLCHATYNAVCCSVIPLFCCCFSKLKTHNLCILLNGRCCVSDAADIPEAWDAIQRDLHKLEKCAHVNLLRFTRPSSR